MRYNPDQDKYADAKSEKKGSKGGGPTQFYGGMFNYGQIFNDFMGNPVGKNNDALAALRYAQGADMIGTGFNTFNAMGLGQFQAGLSAGMMNIASKMGQEERAQQMGMQYNYGMRSLDKQFELRDEFENREFGRDIGMLRASGEEGRKNMAAQSTELQRQRITDGEQNRLTLAAGGDQTRKNMYTADFIAAGKEQRQARRANNAGRNFA